MVDFPHLSGGSSSSSPSRDLYADFGVSKPSSPAEELGESAMIPLGLNDSPTLDVVQNPLDLLASNGVLISDSDEDQNAKTESSEDTQELFKAVQYFSQKDRLEASEERRKNMELMSFIAANGFSTKQVNDFIQKGKSVRSVNDEDIVLVHAHGNEVCPKLVSNDSAPDVEHRGKKEEISGLLGGSMPSSSGVKGNIDVDTLPKTWSSVVANNEGSTPMTLDFYPPDISSSADSLVVIRPPIEVLKEGNNRWKSCLVGGFLNSRLPFKLVEEAAHKLWDKFGLINVFLQNGGFFVFKFSKPEDRDNVLAFGPWYIANKLIVLKHWKEGIDFKSEACTKAPVWVKLHNVPLSYWSQKGLSFLASGIGKPLHLDKLTEKLNPLAYARICVEVYPYSTFPAKLEVTVFDDESESMKSVFVDVEYHNKPTLCQHCKSFGHSLIRCPRANFKWVPKSSDSSTRLNERLDGSQNKDLRQDGDIVHAHSNKRRLSPDPKEISSPDDANAKDGWITVGSADKTPVMPSSDSGTNFVVTPAISNPFLPLVAGDFSNCSSDNYSLSPSPNPLRNKLKLIDEIAVKELKNKDRMVVVPSSSTKKKSKKGGNGGGNPKS